MLKASPEKALRYFEDKLEFTTGPVELHRLIDRGEKARIIDVRRGEDYDKGHIPGAVSMPRETWQTDEGLSHEAVNIVYCYCEVCHMAAEAAKEFAERGFPVMELQGGFQTWLDYGFPVER